MDKHYGKGTTNLYVYSLILLISISFTCVTVLFSFKQGRLATVITYDDIVYFHDGLFKLNLLNEKGLLYFIEHITKTTIHAPLSTFVAMLSFAVFGIHNWAPYAANGIFIFIMLFIVNKLINPLNVGIKFLFFLFFLSVPFVGYTVHEFRPDLPAGLFTAIGLIFLILKSVGEFDIKYISFVSLWFSLALLSKPSASPFTIGIYSLAVGLSALNDFFVKSQGKRLDIIKSSILYITLPIIIASPYYIFNFKHIIDYIVINFTTDKDIWTISLNTVEKFTLYLTGPHGQFMVGRHLYIFLALNIAGIIWHLFSCDLKRNSRLIIFLIIIIVAWIIPSWSAFQNPFFAATMYFLLLLTPVFIINNISAVKKISDKENIAVMLFFFLSTGAGFLFFKPVEFYYGKDKNLKKASLEVADIIHAELLKDSNVDSQIFIYLNGIGAINIDLLNYMRLRDHKKNNLVVLISPRQNMEEWKSFLDRADYALVVEQGMGGLVNEGFPSGKILNETLALVQQDARFNLVRSIKVFTGKHFYLFKKR